MKVFILLSAIFIAVSCANTNTVDEFGPCMLSSRGMQCYSEYVGCRKENHGFREHQKCLKSFGDCVSGDCPIKCSATYKECRHRPGNVAKDTMKCISDYTACIKVCHQNITL